LSQPYTPESLYKSEYKVLFTFFIAKKQNKQEAEDLCGQTFLQMVNDWDKRQFEEASPFWLRSIAKNVLNNKVRSDQTSKRAAEVVDIFSLEIADSDFDPDNHIDQQRQNQALDLCIEQLPPQMNAAIKFRYMRDSSVEETASGMNIRPGTVKSTINHAMAKLKECMQRTSGGRP